MKIYARINILGGRAVRLPQGDVAHAISLDVDRLIKPTFVPDDPQAVADLLYTARV